MANGVRIQFLNQIEDRFTVTVLPKTGWDESYYELKGLAGTIILSSPFSDDSKVKTGIISKQLQFGYLYDNITAIPIDFFVNNAVPFEDDYWVVTLTRNNETLPFFKGFLSQENNRMPFMDRQQPVILIATDGLSTLKNKDFINEAEESFNGPICETAIGKRYTPLFYLIQALGKLNLGLNLQCDSNVTHTLMTGRGTDVTYDPLDHILIDSRVFGEGEGIKSCYDAINILCQTWRCRLYQENGLWYLESLPDRIFAGYRSYSEYEIGAVVDDVFTYTQVGNGSVEYVICEVANSLNIKLVEADAMRYLQTPRGEVKFTFNYKFPTELVNNMKMTQSETPYVGDIGFTPTGGAYEIDCWQYQRNTLAAPLTPTNHGVRYQDFDEFGNVTDDIFYLSNNVDDNELTWFRTALKTYVDARQRLTVTIDISSRTDNTPPGNNLVKAMYILLYGDDGSYWNVNNEGAWYLSNASWSVNLKGIDAVYNDANMKEWLNVGVTTEPIPVAGSIELVFVQLQDPDGGGSNTLPTRFRNLAISYEIGKKGDYNKAGVGSIGSQSEEVVISDCQYRSVIGGLYKYWFSVDQNELYYPQWSFYGIFVTKRRFTELMAKVVYSFQKRIYNKVEGSLKGYMFLGDNGNFQAGFLPRYIFKEHNDKMEYMMTGAYSLDLTTGKWRAVFVEVDQDNTPIVFEGGTPAELDLDAPHEFDFINT